MTIYFEKSTIDKNARLRKVVHIRFTFCNAEEGSATNRKVCRPYELPTSQKKSGQHEPSCINSLSEEISHPGVCETVGVSCEVQVEVLQGGSVCLARGCYW